jgi:hypothetical protein
MASLAPVTPSDGRRPFTPDDLKSTHIIRAAIKVTLHNLILVLRRGQWRFSIILASEKDRLNIDIEGNKNQEPAQQTELENVG